MTADVNNWKPQHRLTRRNLRFAAVSKRIAAIKRLIEADEYGYYRLRYVRPPSVPIRWTTLCSCLAAYGSGSDAVREIRSGVAGTVDTSSVVGAAILVTLSVKQLKDFATM